MTGRISLKLFILRTVLILCGLAALGTILVLGVSSFFGAPRVPHQVVASVASPNGHLKAVLTRIGAGGDTGYLVDVNGADGDSERVANLYGVRQASVAGAPNPVWKGDHALALHYTSAAVARIDQSDLTVAGQHLTVALDPER